MSNEQPRQHKRSLPARVAHRMCQAKQVYAEAGAAAVWRGLLRMMRGDRAWRRWADMPQRGELRSQRQQAEAWADAPLISVVVPLYNTALPFLHQMMASVQRQSYPYWELVLVDASDEAHAKVGAAAKAAAGRDERIRYRKLESNGGIADNTNEGLALCQGDWITLLDHDDVLQRGALFEVAAAARKHPVELIYSDEVVLSADLKKLVSFHFKPDFSPDSLRGCNYITHLCAFTASLLARCGGGERGRFDGAQDYDLVLRLTEQARGIYHIPKVLYCWRSHGESTASGLSQKPYASEAGALALQQHLGRVGLVGTVHPQKNHPGSYKEKYDVNGAPLVSVLIPNKDHIEDLGRCLASLYKTAGWQRMEVLVIDNNSTDPATEPFYRAAEEKFLRLRVLHYEGDFNFAAICNFGAKHAKGEHLLLLNNDTEMISDQFVRELLSYSQRADVGAVGAKLLYPDGTVQHAGLFIGLGNTAGVSHKGHPGDDGGDLYRLCTTQNVSAVTGAALMVKRALWQQLGGMDEQHFGVAFNDVDFCLRLRALGLWNLYTPFALATHYESKSRGYDNEGPAKQRFDKEAAALRTMHAVYFTEGDPFYNPHLTLQDERYSRR